MTAPRILPQEFYDCPPQEAARNLLGAVLVRQDGERRMSAIIIEAEAYHGQEDLACHASHGLTARTRVMFGPPGRAYVYFTYGNHWMLNAVTEATGMASAVLLRAIWPLEGLEFMAENRPQPARRKSQRPDLLLAGWTDGPGKLCQALHITGLLNGAGLSDPASGLYIMEGLPVPEDQITSGPRVGIQNVPEPWLSKPWRYRANLEYISRNLIRSA